MLNQYAVRTLLSFDEIEEVWNDWKKMSWHFFSDIDFYSTMGNVRNGFVRPHVIVIVKNNKPEAIVVGRIENQRMICRFGYKDLYAPNTRFLYIEYGGILGNLCNDTAEIIVSEIESALKNGDADLAFFSHLPTDSSIYKLSRSKPSFLVRDHVPVFFPHRSIELPGAFEVFIKNISSKHRYWLRRMEKALEKNYYGKISVRQFSSPDEVGSFCNDAENIAKRTYQRALGAGFIHNEEMKKRLQLCASLGWMRGYILYVNSEPISYWAATLYKNTLFLDSTGYLPEFRKFEPGTILLMKLIEASYSERECIEKIDFGFGDAPYKQRFGNMKWEEVSIYIFSPTLKGIRLNIIRTTVALLSVGALRIMDRIKVTQKVKKFWRSKLVSRQ